MKEIPLTQGYVAIVDNEDYEELMRWKWYAAIQESQPVARRNTRKAEGGKRRVVLMHRQILRALPGEDVDHANHTTLDNRRSNIRRCTPSQNQGNRCKSTGCSSRFKGVRWHKGAHKWCAQIKYRGVSRHLGLFTDELDAARAYNVAAVEMFGQFALLNDV